MHTTFKRGFTLLELLVVVSIIGMLTSIVLTSISSARAKGQDAAIKANLRSILTQAAVYQLNNGSYGTAVTAAACPGSGTSMFFADTAIRNAIGAAASASGGATRCASDATGFAVSVQLRSSANHWCVDSTGGTREITNVAWTGAACP